MPKTPLTTRKGHTEAGPLPAVRLVGLFALLAALYAALLLSPASVEAKDIAVVQADGAAVKTAGVKDVKEAAIDTALKNAVADALEEIIENEALEVDPSLVETDIYARAVDYVVNFKILSEERHTEEVEVWPETGTKEDPESAGIQPIVPGAELPEAPAPEVRLVESYHIWLEARVDTVLLKDALGRIVLAGEGSTPEVSIVLLDVTDYETYDTVMKALARVTMLEDVTYDSFYPGRMVLSARTAARARTLASRIGREAGDDFIVARGSRGTIIIKAFPRAISFE